MKVLVAIDGSPSSDLAVAEVGRRPWPAGTRIKILFVVHSAMPMIPDPFLVGLAGYYETLADERKLAGPLLQRAKEALEKEAGAGQCAVETESVEGLPKDEILNVADSWGADLIVVGARGRSASQRMFFGSVARAIAEHAHCSVEIVRGAAA